MKCQSALLTDDCLGNTFVLVPAHTDESKKFSVFPLILSYPLKELVKSSVENEVYGSQI